mgnify:CR=1 FL=1
MTLCPFVDFSTYNSQNPFGQFDGKYYPATKHHIGSDFKVPVGTPIKAPADGGMLKAAFNSARGNTGIFVFTCEGIEWGIEFCHLKQKPPLGTYKQGETIAFTGNTGSATTGAHLHVTLHKDAMVTKNYSLLTSEAAFVQLWRDGRIADPYLWFWQKINN